MPCGVKLLLSTSSDARLLRWSVSLVHCFLKDFFGSFLMTQVNSLILVRSLTTFMGLATYLLLWPEDGVMRKDDVRRVFDGSIFVEKAEQYRGRGKKA